ncbi:hypothetical protein AYI69_g5343, partial [Smittium culicis]
MPLANDSEIWLYVLASAIATALGAGVLYIDQFLHFIGVSKRFSLLKSNTFLAICFSGASSIMIYTSVFVLLGESVSHFKSVKDIPFFNQNANLISLLSILAGAYGNNILSAFFVHVFKLDISDSTHVCAHGHTHIMETSPLPEHTDLHIDSQPMQKTDSLLQSIPQENKNSDSLSNLSAYIDFPPDSNCSTDIGKKRKNLDCTSSVSTKRVSKKPSCNSKTKKALTSRCSTRRNEKNPKKFFELLSNSTDSPDLNCHYSNADVDDAELSDHCNDETCALILNTQSPEVVDTNPNCLEINKHNDILFCSAADCLDPNDDITDNLLPLNSSPDLQNSQTFNNSNSNSHIDLSHSNNIGLACSSKKFTSTSTI